MLPELSATTATTGDWSSDVSSAAVAGAGSSPDATAGSFDVSAPASALDASALDASAPLGSAGVAAVSSGAAGDAASATAGEIAASGASAAGGATATGTSTWTVGTLTADTSESAASGRARHGERCIRPVRRKRGSALYEPENRRGDEDLRKSVERRAIDAIPYRGAAKRDRSRRPLVEEIPDALTGEPSNLPMRMRTNMLRCMISTSKSPRLGLDGECDHVFDTSAISGLP